MTALIENDEYRAYVDKHGEPTLDHLDDVNAEIASLQERVNRLRAEAEPVHATDGRQLRTVDMHPLCLWLKGLQDKLLYLDVDRDALAARVATMRAEVDRLETKRQNIASQLGKAVITLSLAENKWARLDQAAALPGVEVQRLHSAVAVMDELKIDASKAVAKYKEAVATYEPLNAAALEADDEVGKAKQEHDRLHREETGVMAALRSARADLSREQERLNGMPTVIPPVEEIAADLARGRAMREALQVWVDLEGAEARLSDLLQRREQLMEWVG